MRALVAGWFSFEEMGATAGDLLVRDVVCSWLEEAGCPYDVATAPPFTGGVRWQEVAPDRYTHLVFTCGPFGNGWPITELLSRFEGSRLVGVDLSMLEPLDAWNPFDVLVERDSSRTTRADVSFLSDQPRVPLVGRVLVHPQKEYGDGRHELAEAAIDRLLRGRDVAVVSIDTRLDANAGGLSTPAQVESLIAAMDVVVTTRLHGMVLALKNAVPVVAVDPIPGGAKVKRQADAIGWPYVVIADALDAETLEQMFDSCLLPAAGELAARRGAAARETLVEVHDLVTAEFGSSD